MAILTYPLNGITYDAEDVEVYLCTRTSGVFASEGHFTATVSGRTVSIGPGLAWMQNEEFHGKAIYNPDTVDLAIAEADAYQARKDRIVLQFDKLLNQTTLVVKEGTPSSNPTAPAIERDELIYELGLYVIDVPASSISVTDANVNSTFLDESVCGIMEDAVTGIPTQELYDQWYAWFSQIQTDTEAFEEQFNTWFADIKEQAEKNMEENQQEFNDWMSDTEKNFDSWMTDTQKDFDSWFDNLEYTLDGDVAGKLEVEIETAQATADAAMEQLASGWVEGFLTDGDGNALLAEDDDENYGITISRLICNCNESSADVTFDTIYPVGSIYMSVNRIDPTYLFGGTWQQIENTFLIAAGSGYTAGTSGGDTVATLSESNLPAHSHSLPSHTHTLPSHTHSLPSHTHSIPSHTHSIPSHTHSIPSHTHSIPSLSGTAASAGAHTHNLNRQEEVYTTGSSGYRPSEESSAESQWGTAVASAGAHTHSVTTNSSTTGSYSGTSGSYSGTTGSTSATSGGTSGTSGSTSGTSGSASGTSGSTGSGTAFSIVPPYLAVYMWQRIA